ncbi:hypothetical protein D9V32_15025 [Mycetocola tolaasinivorans]|uniref:Lactococcin 972 family bacteriocin n=1 Tax=Mycetocola tolaasinivorans TaxID=76635 RepID=A0A3L6ZXW7_9MICO|nr:lactococcin 972 family bacteriocin [Mycetocola tolaasinivorans]RLP72757.1 hypothetical protein D9V32_15025 [Mycetocola tolaasinivorans]
MKHVRGLGISAVAAVALLVPLLVPVGASAVASVATTEVESTVADSQREASALWLSNGVTRQYPAVGGVWEYGFWNAAIRSYYTVNRVHGSTVVLNRTEVVRSIDTAPNYRSVAEKFALNYWGNNDAYYYRVH